MVSGESDWYSTHTERGKADNLTIGEIVSVEIPGTPVVIINSYEIIQDILSKRPSTTGGRKIGYMVIGL
jgi:hypothetical protein